MIIFLCFGVLFSVKAENSSNPEQNNHISDSEEAKFVPTYVYDENDNMVLLYNPNTAIMTAEISKGAYKVGSNKWDSALKKYDYTPIGFLENNCYYGSKINEMNEEEEWYSSVNAIIGCKEVFYNGVRKCAIVISFRGTHDFEDFLNDCYILTNSDGVHSGFASTSTDFFQKCNNVSLKYGEETISLMDAFSEMRNPDSRFKLVVCGHSLGGAVADVFAGYNLYSYGVDCSNVAVYTFEAPKSVNSTYCYEYNNIYNIVSKDDWVTTVGTINGKRIGRDIVYQPDDIFRKENYSEYYVEGMTSEYWSGFINSALMKFINHRAPIYEKIVEEINNDLTSHCYNNTESLYSYYNVKFTQDCFRNFNSILYSEGIGIYDTRLNVKGDCVCDELDMNENEDNYLFVNGNLSFPNYTEEDIESGTIELKGDLYFGSEDMSINNYETKEFSPQAKVVFNGTKTQKIDVVKRNDGKWQSYSIELNNVEINNPLFECPNDGVQKYVALGLSKDTIINNKQELALARIKLNGFQLKTENSINDPYNSTELFCDGGSINLGGDFIGDIRDISGQNIINGNYWGLYLSLKDAQLEVKGDCACEELCLNDNEENYLLVEGDFTFPNEYYTRANIEAGTIEIKGDLSFSNEYSYESNEFKTDAKFIFSGTDAQTIHVVKNIEGEYLKTYDILLNNVEISNTLFECPYEEGVEKHVTLGLSKDTVINNEKKLCFDTVYLNGNNLKTKNGLSGSVNADGGSVNIGGDINGNLIDISGENVINGNCSSVLIYLKDAKLDIKGNCECLDLDMNDYEDNYLLIEGDLSFPSFYYSTKGHIKNGIIEIKGDLSFSDEGYVYSDEFVSDAKVIFSGNNTQKILIVKDRNDYDKAYTITLNDVEIRNPLFECPYEGSVEKHVTLGLSKDTVINNEQKLCFDTVYLNGNNLKTKNALDASINANGGSVNIGGDFSGKISNISGDNSINGNCFSSLIVLENAKLEIMGNCVCEELDINDNEDNYFLVNGDLSFTNLDYSTKSHIKNGTIDIKGDLSFSNEDEYGEYLYEFESGAKVIFSGTETQKIHVVKHWNEYNKICNITLNEVEIKNPLFECPYEENVEKNITIGLDSDTVLYHKKSDYSCMFETNGYKLEFFEIVKQPCNVAAKLGDKVVIEADSTSHASCNWLISSDGKKWERITASDSFSGVNSQQLQIIISDKELFDKQFKFEITNVYGDVLESNSVNIEEIIVNKTISFLAGNEELMGSGTMEDFIVDNGSEYYLPECLFNAPIGYVFDKWEVTIGNYAPIIKNEGECITVSDNTLVKVLWKERNDISYKVEHYKENLTGDYSKPSEIESLVGTTNESVSPQVKRFEGFNIPEAQNTTINANGSTIVKYYYSRKEYKLTWEFDGGSPSGSYTSGNVKYDAPITPPSLTRDGYSFLGWNIELPTSMPAKDLTIKANWKENAEEHVHQLTHIKAKEVTCDENGNKEYWYCKDCNKYYSDENAENEIEKDSWNIAATGHKWDKGYVTKEATEEAEGVMTYTCEKCHETYTEVIPKKEHEHSLKHVNAKAATCTEAGNSEYWYCSKCGKYFSDENCQTEIEKDSYVIAATGHKFDQKKADDKYLKSAATCTEKAVYYYSCGICGETDYNHTFTSGNALGHKWDNGVVTKEATETAEGEKTFTCSVCGEKHTESIPKLEPKIEDPVKAFVTRFYTIILQRDTINDEEIEYYTSRLKSKELDGCSVAKGFVLSPEYTGKGESNLDFVNKMYAAFFNREADDAAFYVNLLEAGHSREVVLAGFVNSPEFKNLCAEYGINPGELVVEPENNNPENNQGNGENNQGNNPSDDVTKLNLDTTNVDPEKLDEYVKNLYLKILGRGYDEGGLQYWKEQIMAGTTYDAATAARVGFFESEEYKNKNKTSEEFVTDCYHAFLNREPEPDGLSYWMNKIDSGEYSKQKVIDLGFGHSNEFKGILTDCGFVILEDN